MAILDFSDPPSAAHAISTRNAKGIRRGMAMAEIVTRRSGLPFLLLHRFRPDPFDGYANQFHRVHRPIAAERSVIDLGNYTLPIHHRAEDCVLTIPWRMALVVMKNWQPPESAWPVFAMASLPGLSKRNPGRNSSRIVKPQLCAPVPVGSPDWIIWSRTTRWNVMLSYSGRFTIVPVLGSRVALVPCTRATKFSTDMGVSFS